MSNLLLDIESLLSSIESVIYIGSEPDTPDNLICLHLTGGFNPINLVSGDTIRNPTLQIIVRDNKYNNAVERAQSIVAKLNGVVNTVINGNDYISISLFNDIFSLGRDDNDRSEFSINFKVVLNN